MPENLLDQLNRLPPSVARILTSLTDEKIAKAAGCSRRTVRRLSQQSGWDKQLRLASSFLEACGIKVRVTIPALHQLRRVMKSKKGIAGMEHLRRTKGTPIWKIAQAQRRIRALERALK